MCFRYKNAYFVSERVDFSRFQIQCSSGHKSCSVSAFHSGNTTTLSPIYPISRVLVFKQIRQKLFSFIFSIALIIISSGFIYKMIKEALLFFSIKR